MTSIPATAWDIAPSPSAPPAAPLLRELGRGRSGVVYVGHEPEGLAIARKVFGSSGLTKLVQLIFLGAPNPYVWNEDAIRCAHLRREILAELVERWFDDQLYVARSRGWAWNADAAAFELRAQLIDGRPPDLLHPLRASEEDQMHVLSTTLMPKLQEHLIEAGFDGMVWQAGKGNPVALNNFLLDRSEGTPRWAWIDLESGVPALAALSPFALFGFYVPRSLRFGRPLFDDVDAERLRNYFTEGGWDPDLVAKAEELVFHQSRWKNQPRIDRSIAYRVAKKDLTEDEAHWYRSRPIRWYTREVGRAAKKLPSRIGRRILRGLKQITALPWRSLPSSVARFLWSQRYRADLARGYAQRRIDAWVRRRQLSCGDANYLRTHLDREESATFVTDFGVHLALKPFVKGFEYWVCPLLYALGLIGEVWLALAILTAGPVARSIYTGGRIIQNTFNGKERPWTALAVGTLPVAGNLAFPIQLLRSSHQEEDDLGRFLLYDGFARIGARVPIWGGEDTLTEHRFNRLADWIISPLRARARSLRPGRS